MKNENVLELTSSLDLILLILLTLEHIANDSTGFLILLELFAGFPALLSIISCLLITSYTRRNI